ncbi:hypothetical protein [Micromonospora maritima]|uniref:hypothetical protein n=1 Tax=Micromonospora maritima TaxID=986711 RepID=UPI00157D2A6A|nr:hypothetical protein [Micromonospora maritima]
MEHGEALAVDHDKMREALSLFSRALDEVSNAGYQVEHGPYERIRDAVAELVEAAYPEVWGERVVCDRVLYDNGIVGSLNAALTRAGVAR